MLPAAQFLLAKIIQSVLTAILISVSVLGNGFVLAIIARFKALRTVRNILVANMALVDLLNAAINLPLRMITAVLHTIWFKGKALAVMTSLSERLFLVLNLASMLVMLANTYVAISFDLRYFTWKTNEKAMVCAAIVWSVSIVSVMLSAISLVDVDLGDAHVNVYRTAIFEEGKLFVASVIALFLILGTVFCFLTIRAIKRKKNERAALNLPPLQAEARLQNDIKATRTIAITIASYCLCYGPTILYAVAGFQKETLTDYWFGFMAWYSLYISSALNPIIYCLRTRRYRSAIKQFLKDPFGSSDFKEKPNTHQNNGDKRQEAKTRKTNGQGVTVKTSNGAEVERDGNQKREMHSGQSRHAMVILSLEDVQVNPHSNLGEVSGIEEKKEEARAPNLPVKDLCQEKGKKVEEDEGVSTKSGLEKASRKPPPSLSKVHPSKDTQLVKTGKQEDDDHCSNSETYEAQESPGNERRGMTTGKNFNRVVKTAWMN